MKITFHRADDLACQEQAAEMAAILAVIPGMEGTTRALLASELPTQDEIAALQSRVDPKMVKIWMDADTGDRHVLITPAGMRELAKVSTSATRWAVDAYMAVQPMIRLLKLSSESFRKTVKAAVSAFAPKRDERLGAILAMAGDVYEAGEVVGVAEGASKILLVLSFTTGKYFVATDGGTICYRLSVGPADGFEAIEDATTTSGYKFVM